MSPVSLRREVGQLLMVGFGGPSIPVELKSLAREFDLGGVVLFARNVESMEQVAGLAAEARALGRSQPAWVAVDQEGGRVARLKHPFTEWPPASTLGRAGEPALARRFAAALAAELAAVGISMDLAPVLDVATCAANPAIGNRALSDDPDTVARLGVEIIRALQEAGVAACAKHFPGHGDTSVDSHLDLPIVDHPIDRLRSVEFVPFRAAFEAGVAGVLVAHLLVGAIDADQPSSLSGATVQGTIRAELGFDGLVLTDDLHMQAITKRMPAEDAAVVAIGAGADSALLCSPDHDVQAAACEALVRAVESGAMPRERITSAMARHERVRALVVEAARRGPLGGGLSPISAEWRPPGARELGALVGSDVHEAVAEEIRRWA